MAKITSIKGVKKHHLLRLNHFLFCFGLVVLGITLVLVEHSHKIYQQHQKSDFGNNAFDDGAAIRTTNSRERGSASHPENSPISHKTLTTAAKEDQNSWKGKDDKHLNAEVLTATTTTSIATSQSDHHERSIAIWEDSSSVLPQWLRDYFSWHRRQTARIHRDWKPLIQAMSDTESITFLWNQQLDETSTNTEEKMQFLVVRCFSFDRKCGGLADRLLPLPYLLQVAHNTSRVLLIHFQKPAPLEEYLVPPLEGGIDWRIPPWLVRSFNFTGDSRRYKVTSSLEWHASNPNETVVQSIFQSYHYGSQNYEEDRLRRMSVDSSNIQEPTFRQVVRDIWRVMFTPVMPIQKMIQEELTSLGLQPGHYAAIHCRVLYAVVERDPQEIKVVTENALHCASELYNNHGPFFISSDSPESIKMAKEYGAQLAKQSASLSKEHQPIVVARSTDKAPLHFGFIPSAVTGVSKEKARKQDYKAVSYVASDYYDTYVDLYLMAMAKCVTHGVGGYGKLASYLSYNETCSSHHFKKKMRVCSWHTPSDIEAANIDELKSHDSLLASLLSVPSQALE